MAVAMADSALAIKDMSERLKSLKEMLDAAHVRLMMSLINREDMEEVIAEAEAA